VTSGIGIAYAGIGAWGVFYQIEDGTNGTAGRYE